MARKVNIHEAKTHLSKLVERAKAGEEIVIARAGDPVAKLIAYEKPSKPRTPGGWEGKVWIAPDFDELPPEFLAAFRGESE